MADAPRAPSSNITPLTDGCPRCRVKVQQPNDTTACAICQHNGEEESKVGDDNVLPIRKEID